jgi:primosomal protein N' (replication factor Y)
MECEYVGVLPNPGRALSQLFTYRLPASLRAAVRLGSQVLVPFGARTVVGVVLARHGHPDREGIREVEAVLEGAPALPEDAVLLAQWMAGYYLCELGEAIRPFLPYGLVHRFARRYRATGKPLPPRLFADPDEETLLRAFESSPDRSLAALQRRLPADRLSRALTALVAQGVVAERAVVLPPEAGAKKVRVVEVAATPEEVAQYLEQHGRRAPARAACLRAAQAGGPLPSAALARKAGVSIAAVQGLVKQGLLAYRWQVVRRVPWAEAGAAPSAPPVLTPEQSEAVGAISSALRAARFEPFLLYGVTASGKTEVFLHAIAEAMAQGRQSLVLMPEISLTAQAIGIYRARFGDRVAILHSALSAGERWDEGERIRSGEAMVVIGARSALFAPVRSLGLIVIDEEHESSYKQEQAPRYHAREAALERGRLNSCPVVLASATPAVESFYQAGAGGLRLLRLPARVEARPLPAVRVVDLRGAARLPAIFSNPLRQGIAGRLQAQEQVILFLNRRGYATFLICPACGHSLRCADCGIAFTYYRDDRSLRCHHCGLARGAPETCPNCGGREISFSGFGTERVEAELARLFPQARAGRLDRDTTAAKGAHVRIVGRFREAETNVLIGTQMVAKGFDFPDVTLVGVISADTALNLPDFRAGERTFQLLTQVAGRSGRGEKAGQVVVQTYRPDHYAIVAAAAQDYEAFYRQEIAMREELGYPPFSQVANIVVSASTEAEAERRAGTLAEAIRAQLPGLGTAKGGRKEERKGGTAAVPDVLGPAPAPLARLRGRYRWHLLVRAPHGVLQPLLRAALAAAPAWAKSGAIVDVDPASLM